MWAAKTFHGPQVAGMELELYLISWASVPARNTWMCPWVKLHAAKRAVTPLAELLVDHPALIVKPLSVLQVARSCCPGTDSTEI